MLPNFIIVGAPKAGTTSLYHYLSEHPQVFMSIPKEVNYFSREEIEAQDLYYKGFKTKNEKKYKKLFKKAEGKKAIGEASVSYLFYPKTPQKIKDMLPDAKIIILLRDPVRRGFSHYLMDYRMGLVDLPYRDIVVKTAHHEKLNLYYQQYVELGLYYDQVKRYLDIFGNEQVKVYLNEDLQRNAYQMVSDLFGFLDIDRQFVPDLNKTHNVFWIPDNKIVRRLYAVYPFRSIISRFLSEDIKARIKKILFNTEKKTAIQEDIRNVLLDIYTSDIRKLEKLISRDLSHWYK